MALYRCGGGAAQLNDIQSTGALFGKNGTSAVAANIDASLSYTATMNNFNLVLVCNGKYATISGSGSDAYGLIKYKTDGTAQYVGDTSGAQNISDCQAVMLMGSATISGFTVTRV